MASLTNLYATYGDHPDFVDISEHLLATSGTGPLFTAGAPPPRPLALHDAERPIEVFASLSHVRRAAHLLQGRRVVPHVGLIEEALDDPAFKLAYIQIRRKEDRGGLAPEVDGLPVIRLWFEPYAPIVLAITTLRTIPRLEARDYEVERFPTTDVSIQGAPANTTLYLVRDCLDESKETKALVDKIEAEVALHWRVPDGYILALTEGQDSADFHPPHGSHGHTVWLLPETPPAPAPECPVLTTSTLSAEEVALIGSELTEKTYDENLWCWTGIAPLSGTNDRILSRGKLAPGNERAAKELCRRLEEFLAAGDGKTKTHLVQTHPDEWPRCWTVEGWIDGDPAVVPQEIVVVGAHLDSIDVTAGKQESPGADDDASGIAAVLTIAKTLRALANEYGPPRRSVRFVLGSSGFRVGRVTG
jgi:hypothetical protein